MNTGVHDNKGRHRYAMNTGVHDNKGRHRYAMNTGVHDKNNINTKIYLSVIT